MEEQSQAPMRAPKSVMYGDQLPLGIEAKSQKRLFFPTTGDTYTPTGNSICRIDINYDGLMDTAQSYLEFNLTNKSGKKASFDLGHPLIRKLTISSGGVVLEEIHDYNVLVGGILFPAQAGVQNLHYEGMNNNGLDQRSGFTAITAAGTAGVRSANALLATDGGLATRVLLGAVGGGAPFTGDGSDESAIITATKASASTGIRDAIADCVAAGVNAGAGGITGDVKTYANPNVFGGSTLSARTGCFNDDQQVKQHYKLVSGLLDNDKYLPLVLMNAGITLEIEFAPANDCMVSQTAGGADYEVSEIRYVAHLIDLERSFYDRLRMVQQNSGGVLQIAGQSYRGFRGQQTNNTTQSINCPARVRSIKSFFFKYGRAGDDATYNLSGGGHNSLTDYQLSIGATRYPPTANKVHNTTNKSGGYTELQKAFGKIGSNLHPDQLNSANYLSGNGNANTMNQGDIVPFAPFGIDLESFRHEIENGVDTSSRALPITLHTTSTAVPEGGCLDCFMFVLYDSLFYINMDGSVSVSN